MKLSIIIPCYKVEKYICRCLDSVLSISLPLDQYEIVCFDDCSPDTTPAILDDYARRYNNIVVIHSEKNVGHGAARNKAFERAKGEYVWFVDSDDMIVPAVVSDLIDLLEQNQLDVITFDYKDIDESEIVIGKSCLLSTEVLNGRVIANLAFDGGLVYSMGYAWRFIIRKEYLTINCIVFPEGMKYGEDTVWMVRLVLFAKRIMASSKCAYLYWHHETSICGQLNRYYPAGMIYDRCVLTASQLLDFSNELIEKFNTTNEKEWFEYAQEIEGYTKSHYINQLPVLLGRTSRKERVLFHQIVKNVCVMNVQEKAGFLAKIMLNSHSGRFFSMIFSVLYKMLHIC